MQGFTFNNKHNWNDYGTIMQEYSIQLPAKRKVKESVPGMSGYFDFSTVVSGGEIVYDTREITIKLLLMADTKEDLYRIFDTITNWLLEAGKSQLKFDFIFAFYFQAEIESVPTWTEFIQAGDYEIKFVAEPFKYGVDLYGNLLWDNIDFNLPDYIQDTDFSVSGSKTVTICVPGNHSIIPSVVVNSDMSCTLNSYTATFTTSKTIDWLFKLKPGANSITIVGTGNIEFQFRKEVL